MYIDQIDWKGDRYDIYAKEVENAGNSVIDFNSKDNLNPSEYDNSIELVVSGETLTSLCEKFSATTKNVRYLGNLVGDEDISDIDSGTITGAIALLSDTVLGGGVTRLGTDTIGSNLKFIYLDEGIPTESTATVGSAIIPIYMNSGTMTASSSTIGGTAKPVYLNGGAITALSSTVGSSTKPVYLDSGTITVSSSTVGSETVPIYLSSGTITASTSTVGGSARGVYLNSGTITALNSTVGSSSTPVYMSSGTITACSSALTDYLPLTGGTVTGRITINTTNTSGIYYTQTGSTGAACIDVIQSWGNGGTGLHISLQCGSGGVNRGLYDNTAGAWTIYRDSDGIKIPSGTTISSTLSVSGHVTLTGSNNIRVQHGYGLYGLDYQGSYRTIATMTGGTSGNQYNFGTGGSSCTIHIGSTSTTSITAYATNAYGFTLTQSNSSTACAIRAQQTWGSGQSVSIQCGSSGENRGLHDETYGQWIVRVNTNKRVLLGWSGCDTPTIYGVYGNGNSGSANIHVTSKHHFQQSGSSSERYKDIIRELTAEDIKDLYDMPTYLFKYKEGYLNSEDERYDKEVPGFIAERWNDVMPIAVDHEGELPEMWNSNIVVPLMFEMIKNDHNLITELQEKISQLEA